MLLVVFSLLSVVTKAFQVSTTWIWPSEGSKEIPEEIYLEGFEEYSFIQLAFAVKRLSIVAVQKSNRLSPEVKFCSTALPAAISTFLDLHSLSIQNVKVIGVLNAAEPSEAGCRCYVRPMIAMGFSNINGRTLMDQDVPAFCQDSQYRYIEAEIPEGSTARILTISPMGQKWISSAQSYNTYY